MSIAALIRDMANAGASAEAIALAVEALEAKDELIEHRRSAARERKRRQREKERDESVTVTGHDEDGHGTEPKTKVSPTPPSKTQPELPPIVPQNRASRRAEKVELEAVGKRIWGYQPVVNGKRRSAQPDVQRALASAVQRGGDPAAIEAACRAYFALPDCRRDGGAFAKGAHRLIENDRWREYLPAEVHRVEIAPFPEARVRKLAVTRMGEDWTVAWLDPCGWEDGEIIARPTAAQRIRQEIGGALAKIGVTVTNRSQAA